MAFKRSNLVATYWRSPSVSARERDGREDPAPETPRARRVVRGEMVVIYGDGSELPRCETIQLWLTERPSTGFTCFRLP